ASQRLITHTSPPRCRVGSRLATRWYELDRAVGPKLTSEAWMRRRSAMHRVARNVGSCARHAPLGSPVVPDVYERWATSVSSVRSGGGLGADDRRSGHDWAPSWGPSMHR